MVNMQKNKLKTHPPLYLGPKLMSGTVSSVAYKVFFVKRVKIFYNILKLLYLLFQTNLTVCQKVCISCWYLFVLRNKVLYDLYCASIQKIYSYIVCGNTIIIYNRAIGINRTLSQTVVGINRLVEDLQFVTHKNRSGLKLL